MAELIVHQVLVVLVVAVMELKQELLLQEQLIQEVAEAHQMILVVLEEKELLF